MYILVTHVGDDVPGLFLPYLVCSSENGEYIGAPEIEKEWWPPAQSGGNLQLTSVNSLVQVHVHLNHTISCF